MGAWVFDLDGTLTVPQHDFAGLKRQLGLDPALDVLAGIAARPAAERDALHARVAAWEREHVADARPADGAVALVERLAAAGEPLGVLTRNTRASALHTLETIGLAGFFDGEDVVGRGCAAAKPAPDGLILLLDRWGVPASEATMVGDWIHDLEAGRAAGTRTIWVDHAGDGRFSGSADRTVRSLREV
ncbi:MAG: HAD family hydrolase [Myxococcales bacterium]|nr:HAD family hydrolase [Myxococcales bacterium]MCB9691597.1 HAD family hydrolase [Alphaproteobacteria bacterium]